MELYISPCCAGLFELNPQLVITKLMVGFKSQTEFEVALYRSIDIGGRKSSEQIRFCPYCGHEVSVRIVGEVSEVEPLNAIDEPEQIDMVGDGEIEEPIDDPLDEPEKRGTNLTAGEHDR